jgi:hypothetical protein
MFYTRINKIKVFNNREGFLGLFNKAEMRIYSYVTASFTAADAADASPTLSDFVGLPDEAARKQWLAGAVRNETAKFAQSNSVEINGVKDNRSLTFGEAGLAIYQSEHIPEALNIQLWVIESDEDVRHFAVDMDKIIDSDAFKGLFTAVETALTVANPVLSGAIAVGGVAIHLLRQKLCANKDDLAGYWQVLLNRAEHYPHGLRDRQDVYDMTGNILVDYTLFGIDE